MKARAVLAVLLASPFVSLAGPELAAKIENAPIRAKIDFSRDILPVISSKCFHCHGPDEKHREAKLRLDVREEAVKDRKGSFAIKPGDLKKSELITRITTKDEDDVMPPVKEKKPLTPREIELFKKWIQQGAPYAEHWAFIKPKLPVVPKVSGVRVTNPIDGFIAAKLKEVKLKQSPAADRHTLIRRVSLDLTGLPPTPAEVDAFVNDKSANAFEKVVDRLLASSAYGERMARMWLDIARYADSAGYGSDPLRLNIWPYRDWVINAFNRNLPYDLFTLEQLAGDLLPNATEEQQVATAFHRNTMTNTEGGTDDEEFRVAAVKDRIAVTVQAWMGLTMGCAQCHTHKFDPISNQEYYQFFALFNQTEDSDKPTEEPTMPLLTKEQREKQEQLKQQIYSLEKQINSPTPEQLTRLAAWEKDQGKPISWTTLEPVELHGGKNAKLVKQDAHSVLVTGSVKSTDPLVVKARTDLKNITAVRLEILPEERTGKPVAGLTVNEFKVQTLPMKEGAKKARFVRVELPGPGRMLSLAEVQVFSGGENVATKGKASQSSTDFGGDAKLAIDGNTDGDYFKAKSTTHTTAFDDPWWEVDLGGEFAVDNVAIWNRTDGGTGTRLVRFKVLALDAARATVGEQMVNDSPAPDATVSFGGGRAVKLANATADAARAGSEADKAIDGDAKTGWAPGVDKAHEAVFETTGKVGEDGGTLLTFNLTPGGAGKAGEAPVGRFRISVTTQAKPVRVLPENIRAIVAVAPEKRSEKQRAELFAHYRQFEPSLTKPLAELAKLKKELADVKPVLVPVMKEFAKDKQRETHILTKGNFLAPGDKVEPGFLKAFNAPPKDAPLNRIGVARYLTSPDNPLTARVAVNRFWAQLFGIGLVETEEDFGTQGQAPSHPELLDWLAVTFMSGNDEARMTNDERSPNVRSTKDSPSGAVRNSGLDIPSSLDIRHSSFAPRRAWDMKALVKLIVMSATYQQLSLASADAAARDPRNLLLSHYPRRRLDAEAVRDQALALSGLLSKKIGGPSVYPPQPDGLWRAAFNGQRAYPTSTGEDRYRRALYTFWRRTIPYPSMATFDAPSRENCTVRRLPTNTPLQAFVTLNDPAFVEMAQSLGRRVVREGGASVADRVRYGLKLALSRPPTDAQVQTLVSLYEKELAHFRADAAAAKKMSTDPLGPLPAGLDAAEAAAWTVVGNVLLNLDGVLTKG
ncbi:MAG: DUF1549 domain-containing protein [Verrucomicrobia bacterium]|nr:DUF1549 domain-containing protein [Verrucomicrobiota bacterium]